MLLLCFAGCLGPQSSTKDLSDELNIFNWEDYFGETTLEDFEQQFGVKVNLYTFEDEEYMISALESNPGMYDLAVTSDSTVSELVATRSLAEIDKENIPNIQYLTSQFTNPSYDPDNTYSVPYFWGTTGIAVNTSIVTKNVTSWSILWDWNYSGNITMLNNKYEVMATALKLLGYSINTNNLSQLHEAEQLLISQRPHIQGYDDPQTIIEKLVQGEVALAHCYVGEANIAADRNDNITYVIPSEGAPLWVDTFIIPVDAQHKYTAEIFINYILEPEVHADIANYQWQACPNEAATAFIDTEILDDPGIYPEEDVLEKCEYFTLLQNETYSRYNKIWAELQ